MAQLQNFLINVDRKFTIYEIVVNCTTVNVIWEYYWG